MAFYTSYHIRSFNDRAVRERFTAETKETGVGLLGHNVCIVVVRGAGGRLLGHSCSTRARIKRVGQIAWTGLRRVLLVFDFDNARGPISHQVELEDFPA
jgi:hypothetical protein